MNRFIPVAFGRGNEILESTWNHLPTAMQNTESAIAIFLGFRNDAERIDIGELFECDMALLHLFPNGIRMLLTPRNFNR